MGSRRRQKEQSRPEEGAPSAKRKNRNTPVRRKRSPFPLFISTVVLLLLVGWGAKNWQEHARSNAAEVDEPTKPIFSQEDYERQALSLEEMQEQQLLVDVHEHIGELTDAPVYLDVMNELGIKKIYLMGSSKFTLTLNESFGFTGYDENNEQLMKILQAYPDRFEAWPTISPTDPKKLDKLKDLIARGATGLKLYTGHGYLTKSNEYIFHPVAMDDPDMLPVYAFLQENFIPVVIHVNPFEGKPGFAQEFVAVLTQFPDMKVIAPHFILSSIKSTRLREFMDTFPNLYTDVSFGDAFMAAGLTRISKSPRKFQKLLLDYQDRVMFASDLVLTNHPTKTREWARTQLQAYLDMLSKDSYETKWIPGKKLRGLKLPDYILEKILYKNADNLRQLRPAGTKIEREINWDRVNVKPLKREPGQAFAPPPKK